MKSHGVLSRAEARRAGLTARQISTRVQAGDWEAVYPNVFRTTAMPVTPEQRVLAAVLATGVTAVASHQSAVWLWGLADQAPGRAAVTVGPGVRPRNRGFDLHHSTDLDLGRVLVRRGIACTDPLRSLVDYAAVAEGAAIDRSTDVALARGLVTVNGLEQEIARLSRRGRRGVAALRDRLEVRGFVGAPDPSVLESITLRLLARWRIHVAGTEVAAGPEGEYRLDVALADGVALEVDGYKWHSTPEQKAHDDARRNRIRLAGVLLLVYSWSDVVQDGARVAMEVRQALATVAGAAGGGHVPPARRGAVTTGS